MKILSLDISSHAGWAFFVRQEKLFLESYGVIDVPKPIGEYPEYMLVWSKRVFNEILGLVQEFNPDFICLEETTKGSKNHLSQKMLEWVHHHVAAHLVLTKTPHRYFQTGEWRVLIGAKMSKEERENNKAIRKAREKGIVVVKNGQGKRIGKITKKHVNVRMANELFDLDLKIKNNNEADAILMGYAYDILIKQQKEEQASEQSVESILA